MENGSMRTKSLKVFHSRSIYIDIQGTLCTYFNINTIRYICHPSTSVSFKSLADLQLNRILLKLAKVSNDPSGKNSPNLFTLVSLTI
jgi:hypothetical protein